MPWPLYFPPGGAFRFINYGIRPIGAFVGGTLILFRKQEWSSKLPYGPYIAVAAVIWIFGGRELVEWWFTR